MSDNVTDITQQILIGIRDRLDRFDKRFDGVDERLDGLSRRMDSTNERIDTLILAAGAGRRDHEERITRIEQRLDRIDRRRRP